MVVAQDDLVFVGSRLLGNELEYQLFALAYLQDALLLAQLEARWNLDLPLCGLLSDIPDHDWLFGDMLDWDLSEVKKIWEIQHGSAADSSDWHDELLSLSQDHQVVRVVRLGLWRELDEERDLHARGYSLGHVVDVGCVGEARAGRFL